MQEGKEEIMVVLEAMVEMEGLMEGEESMAELMEKEVDLVDVEMWIFD